MTTRAKIAAWSVFISMAGTTMSFQVYHSVKHGQMPWPLAYLYGIVPLLISMLVIEFVSGWKDAPKWARPSAYAIIAGSMFLSAAATGAVVLHAAPPRSSLLFGLLLDGAAILAARFLITGPARTAAAEEAARQAALNAERAARQAELEAAIAGWRQAEGERDTARADAESVSAREAALRIELESARAALKTAAEKPDKPPRKPRDRKSEGETEEQKLGTEAAALAIIAQEPDISGSELGRRLGATPGYGRTLMRKLSPASAGGDS